MLFPPTAANEALASCAGSGGGDWEGLRFMPGRERDV